MNLSAALFQFLLAAIPVAVAGTFLTRCADAIAVKTGLGHLLVGSVLLAAATSLPELTVDITAIRLGLADMAAGDLLGSSLTNLLILALADLLTHERGRLLSRASAAHALAATASIVLTALVAIAIHLGGRFGAMPLGGAGWGSLLILGTYALLLRMIYFAQRQALDSLAPQSPEPGSGMTLRLAVPGFILSAGAILVTAPFVARTAGALAEVSGLGNTFVGTTFVAFSTSLPELVATLAAVRMKAFDLALGNIFGSNAVNMILFVPLDLVTAEPLFAAIGQTHILTALAVIIATSVAVLGQLYSVERRIPLLEPDAWLMIVVIMGTLALIYHAR